jgi:hypothetical protein
MRVKCSLNYILPCFVERAILLGDNLLIDVNFTAFDFNAIDGFSTLGADLELDSG